MSKLNVGTALRVLNGVFGTVTLSADPAGGFRIEDFKSQLSVTAPTVDEAFEIAWGRAKFVIEERFKQLETAKKKLESALKEVEAIASEVEP